MTRYAQGTLGQFPVSHCHSVNVTDIERTQMQCQDEWWHNVALDPLLAFITHLYTLNISVSCLNIHFVALHPISRE
jgi:hypothetical protein